MKNKAYALEWLQFGYKNLYTAKRLYEINHCTDIIGAELQQGIEKILKSIYAYNNLKIKKTHNLEEIASELTEHIIFDDFELDLLDRATYYYKVDRYPNPNYCLPERKEIKEILDFSESLLEKVCTMIETNLDDLTVGIL